MTSDQLRDSSSVLRLILGALALVALVGAIVLVALDHDASRVWDAFGVTIAVLAGQHIPVPNKPSPPE